jgi:hypothetical protein
MMYVAGIFRNAGNGERNNVGVGDGALVQPGGGTGGFTPDVNAIAVSGTHIYVGGSFTYVYGPGGTQLAGTVAMWDGSDWDTLGGGLVGAEVNALVIDPDGIYAGGEFITLADNATEVNNIAFWDSEAWHDIGGTFANPGGGVDAMVNAPGVQQRGEQYLCRRPALTLPALYLIKSLVGASLTLEWYGLGNSERPSIRAGNVRR